jgi:hypothetical protein
MSVIELPYCKFVTVSTLRVEALEGEYPLEQFRVRELRELEKDWQS